MAEDTTQRDLGRLEGKMDRLLAAFEQEREASHESRKALYERVGTIETDIKISAKVDAQVRDRLDAFDTKLTNEVMPTINEVKRWKITGVTVLAMVGMAGAAIGSFLWWAWDVIVEKWSGGP